VYDPPTAAVFLLQSFREWSGAGKPAPPATAKSCPRWNVLGAKNSLARGVVQSAKT